MSEAGTQIPEQAVQKVDVLIMAGGSASALGSDVPCKGVFPINGKPMVEYIVDAMRASSMVDRIFVTAPTNEGLGDWVSKVDGVVVTDGDFVQNGLAGGRAIVASASNPARPFLGCTGDIPAITPEAVDDFAVQSLASGVDFTYMFISKETMEGQIPGAQRSYFKLKEGTFTSGNMMLVSAERMQDVADFAQRFFEARKSPLQVAKMAPLGCLLKFV
ncbi:MAG: nucleotidyltransferase family protein, partial [Coriobacteriales bacterium]|nr:nucleotidyltransferase family protein [Coriobacteriales bacterium]